MSAYARGIVVFGVAFVALGIAMIVRTALEGFGVGLLLGALFVALGAARLYLVFRRR
jgi:uncharacterized membrane protein HdeD (DUF308 family)